MNIVDLRDQLRPLDPADAEPLCDAPDWAMFHQIVDAPFDAAPRRRAVTWRLATVVLPAAIVAATVIAGHFGRQHLPALPELKLRSAVTPRASSQVPGSASAVLVASALASERRVDAAGAVNDGIRYQKLIAAYMNTVGGDKPASALVPEIVETWAAADGTGEIRHTPAAPIWPSSEDRERWQDQAPDLSSRPRSQQMLKGDLTPRELPPEPELLLSRLRRDLPESYAYGSRDATAWLFNGIHELLLQPALSGELQAALYRVAARLPGLEVTGPVTDQLGRPGVALGVTSAYAGFRTRYEMIIDPSSGQMLEYQAVLLERAGFVQAPPPVQLSAEILTASGIAPSIGVAPLPAEVAVGSRNAA